MEIKIQTLLVLVLFTGGPGIVCGEESTDKFSAQLADLKNGADKLSEVNGTLDAKNNDLKRRLGQLQLRLQQLADDNNDLTRASLKLQDVSPSRAKKIVQLEKGIFDIDNAMEKLAEETKENKDALDRAGNEDRRLGSQLADLENGLRSVSAADASLEKDTDHTKEKLHLLKMTDESKQKQQELYRQMANVQKQVPVTVITVETSGNKQSLLMQINQLQEEIDRLSAIANQPAQGIWDENQMRQLEAQIRNLKKNHDELEDLTARMQQKVEKTAMNKEQIAEQNRLRANLENIGKENKKLKQDLNDLRQQMVELDKRNTTLQSLVRD